MKERTVDELVQEVIWLAIRLAKDSEFRSFMTEDEKLEGEIRKLGLPPSSAGPFRQLVHLLERMSGGLIRGLDRDSEEDVIISAKIRAEEEKFRVRTRDIQLQSFNHIDQSFITSLVMSIFLFLVGMILLCIAVARALTETDVSTATLTIAGLGIADFVVLFYSRPWQDIQTNLTSSQQVKIIATSYLSSLSLLGPDKNVHLKSLAMLTRDSVEMLGDFGSGSQIQLSRAASIPMSADGRLSAASFGEGPQPASDSGAITGAVTHEEDRAGSDDQAVSVPGNSGRQPLSREPDQGSNSQVLSETVEATLENRAHLTAAAAPKTRGRSRTKT